MAPKAAEEAVPKTRPKLVRGVSHATVYAFLDGRCMHGGTPSVRRQCAGTATDH